MAFSAAKVMISAAERQKKQEQAVATQPKKQLMTKPDQDKIRASMAFRRRSQERD